MSELQDLFEDLGGVASVTDLAEHFELNPREVRNWAEAHDLPRVGNNYAFTLRSARDFEADLDGDDDPDETDEDEEEDADEEEDSPDDESECDDD